MNYAIIRQEFIDKMSSALLTIDDIGVIISDIINYLEIGEYLKQVCLLKDTNLAKYDFRTRTIKINYDGIVDDAINLYSGDNTDLVLFININIIESTVHEIVHVFQNAAIHEFDGIYSIFREEISNFESMNSDDYDEYYDCLIFERDAIISSYETILIILKRYFNNQKMFDYFVDELCEQLRCGYGVLNDKILSPLDYYYNDLLNMEAPEVVCDDSYQAMKIGVPVDDGSLIKNDRKVRKLVMEQNYLK